MGLKRLSRLPSEYLKEHAHWGFFDDPIKVQLRHYVGVDRIMWSTDFPQIVTRWPNSLQVNGGADDWGTQNEKRQILAGNAVKFSHLDG